MTVRFRMTTHDQETEIGQVSVVFAEEKSEDRETEKSRHVQEQGCGEETRTGGSVFQTALGFRALWFNARVVVIPLLSF